MPYFVIRVKISQVNALLSGLGLSMSCPEIVGSQSPLRLCFPVSPAKAYCGPISDLFSPPVTVSGFQVTVFCLHGLELGSQVSSDV